jgi:peptide/nickel transport system substrate-binding protein
VGGEPRTLVPSIGGGREEAADHLFGLVHDSLVTYDDQARPLPRVAQELPSLERGTWRINPDGSMETTWQLRADVRWHDGEPLTADDVVFSWRVFADPAVPVASRRVAKLIESIESPSTGTVVMRWRARYAFADQLSGFDLTLLPSHLLQATFELRREQIAGHPYWRNQFVGLGPYRIQRWPPGSSIELLAFDRYFLGPPRIPEISVRFVPDPNTGMAGVLTGAIDVLLPRKAMPGILRTVRQRWASGEEGALAVLPGYSWVYLAPQFNAPQPEDLTDPRIRRALAYAVDREGVAEAVIGDRSLASALWVPMSDPRYPTVARSMTNHEYDPNRARELFREAGWRRESADDVLVNHGRRFELELTTISDWERVSPVVSEYWRRIGASVRETVLSLGAITDRQVRARYAGIELAAGVPDMALLDGRLHSSSIPGSENQWVGANRGRYSRPEMDTLLDRVWSTPDRAAREGIEGELARYISTERPLIGLFFYPAMAMVRSSVRQIRPPATVSPVGRLFFTWNAHEWEKV